MEQSRRKQLERLSLSGAVASLLGGTAYALTKRHNRQASLTPPQPEILNNELIAIHKRRVINAAALQVICTDQPSRARIMQELSITKTIADYSLGFLSHYGLISRHHGSRAHNIPAHYQPAPELTATLLEPEHYPLIEQALQDLLAHKEQIRADQLGN